MIGSLIELAVAFSIGALAGLAMFWDGSGMAVPVILILLLVNLILNVIALVTTTRAIQYVQRPFGQARHVTYVDETGRLVQRQF